MKNILICIPILMLCFSCNKSDKNLKALQDDVMAVHDEIMPKMGEIMDLKDKLATKLEKMDSTAANYMSIKQETDSLNYLLTGSDNNMMDWMDEYNPDTLKALSAEDAEKYLLDQKDKIKKIKEGTYKNIEIVKGYLKK